ncbi:MAG TPA: hypothetical protein VK797_02845 [Tepidisphaeraceae bacterium]|nr:hypothetical protein [Tepidisphaeraceae bacterium]
MLLLVAMSVAGFAQRIDGAEDRPTPHPAQPTTRPVSLKDARRIVFLVDTQSGLWPVFKSLREELSLAVANLRDDQFFTLIVLRDNAAPSVFSQNPIRADEVTKQSALAFVAAIETQHTTNPIPGAP